MRDDFAVLICSHGRAETLTSYKVLREQGYTGKIIIVIDDEDDQSELYKASYEFVEVFCKEDYFRVIDGVIQGKQKSVIYARNACFNIEKKYGLLYFVEMDDDFTDISARYVDAGKLRSKKIMQLDELFEEMILFFEHKNVVSLSLGVQGDYIGGAESRGVKQGIMRACFGGFFLMKTDRRVNFVASMNEDYVTSLLGGQRGDLFLRLGVVMASSKLMGGNIAGNQETYEKFSPFTRAFLGVITRADAVKVNNNNQIQVSWKNAVPMIISERWKKHA